MMGASYRIMTPADWDRIPLEPQGRQRAIAALGARQFKGIDNAPHLRAQLERGLAEQAQAAFESGGLEMYLSSMTVGPIPLTAALTVSRVLLTDGEQEPPLEGILDSWSTAEGSKVATCELANLPAGRALRRSGIAAARSTTLDGEPMEVAESFFVDWVIPLPENDGTALMLNFNTVLVSLEESMAGLFDAVAATLSWINRA